MESRGGWGGGLGELGELGELVSRKEYVGGYRCRIV